MSHLMFLPMKVMKQLLQRSYWFYFRGYSFPLEGSAADPRKVREIKQKEIQILELCFPCTAWELNSWHPWNYGIYHR